MREPIDHRRASRYRITASLEYVCSERMLSGKGRLRNISVTGMYVEDSDHDLELGDVVRAPLWLLDEETTAFLHGEVVRAEAGGFAVRLQELDLRTEAILSRALSLVEEQE